MLEEGLQVALPGVSQRPSLLYLGGFPFCLMILGSLSVSSTFFCLDVE